MKQMHATRHLIVIAAAALWLALAAAPTTPVASSQDAKPVQPAQPGQPQPVEPVQPTDPGVAPVEPVEPEPPAKPEFTIAVCGPMTGAAAAFGTNIARAAKLKEAQINAAGGLKSRGTTYAVRIRIVDDKGDSDEARGISERLVNDDSVVAVVGHFNSPCSLAARAEYNRVGLVELSPGSTNDRVCRDAAFTFRNLPADRQAWSALADHVHDTIKAEHAAVLYGSDDYGRGGRDTFEARATKLGVEVTSIAYRRERTHDFKPLVQQAKDSGATALVICGLYSEGALIARAVRDLKWDVPMLGGDGLQSPALIENGGKATDGMRIYTAFTFPDPADASDEMTAFIAGYKELSGGDEPDIWAALTWDALGQVLEAIRQGGPTRRMVRAQLAMQTSARSAYPGITGPIWFDDHGDMVAPRQHFLEVRDGKFVTWKPAK